MNHKFKTGDLLLCDGNGEGILGYFGNLIKFFTMSSYSHIGMVLQDPSFIHPTLKGTYVWESSWEGTPDPQDGKIKLGVQITPLDTFLKGYSGKGKVFLRKVVCGDGVFNDEALSKIHDVVYKKPYDIVPKDWLGALLKRDTEPQKTDRFWCSALVGYIYTKLGLLGKDTDWSILRPSDFSEKDCGLDFIGCSLDKEVLV